ncbi:MAG TPA: hypothetical protein VHB77_03735, partial [Planctomycetaceae bacterium]|nr:hypothetical protein [Planctomycetaceae bacterium]
MRDIPRTYLNLCAQVLDGSMSQQECRVILFRNMTEGGRFYDEIEAQERGVEYAMAAAFAVEAAQGAAWVAACDER